MSVFQQGVHANISPRMGLRKLVEVNHAQGNRGLGKQQATTRVIYDSLAVGAAQTYYRFFDNVASRTFPYTNLSENKLQVNESLVVKWVNFHIYNSATSISVSSITTAGASYFRADFWLEVANSMVFKPMPLEQAAPFQNRHAQHTAHESIMMETDVVIPSLLEFVMTLRVQNLLAVTNTPYYVCTLEGQATIYKPNSRF